MHFADDMGGPSHDIEQFRLFLEEHDVPQQLALLCLDAKEVNITFFVAVLIVKILFVALLILKCCIICTTTNLILR